MDPRSHPLWLSPARWKPWYLLLLVGTSPAHALAQTPGPLPGDSAQDTYLDEIAQSLVLGARHARDTARLAIGSYAAVIHERMRFAAPGHRRDRRWTSGERAVRVRWSRSGPNQVHILGDRFDDPGPGGQGFPGFFREPRTERFAAEPYGVPFLFGLGPPFGEALGADHFDVLDPLGADAARYYQFRSGDTTRIRLDGGREIETVAVTVIPRTRSIRLVAAILWIDPSSLALVRVAYRPAKRVDQEMERRLLHHGEWQPLIWVDSGSGAPGDDPARPVDIVALPINLAARGLAGKIEMDLSTVVVDFEPWEGRWWLPRTASWKGHFGKDMTSAIQRPPAGVPFTVDWSVKMEAVRAPGDEPRPVPNDPEGLANRDQFPSASWGATHAAGLDNSAVAAELAGIGIGDGGGAIEAGNPWFFRIPGTSVGLMRHTPVEGFSVGGAVRRDFGWWRSELTVRAATGALALPDMEFALQHDHPGRATRFSVYRSLRRGPLGIGGIDGRPGYYTATADSTTADTVTFHWTRGTMIRLTPGDGGRVRFSLSVFAERDEDIETGDERTRVGGALEWKPWWGAFEDGSVGGGANVIVRGSLGDDPHVKTIVEGALLVPLGKRFSLGLQAGMAGVWGDPAPQDRWEIATDGSWIRGYRDAIPTSRTWMGRVDLQRPIGLGRLSAFADWASAEGADFCAAGVGIVFMDGLVRFDLARRVDCGRAGPSEAGWRFHPGAFKFF